jgi:hypothetical protein
MEKIIGLNLKGVTIFYWLLLTISDLQAQAIVYVGVGWGRAEASVFRLR